MGILGDTDMTACRNPPALQRDTLYASLSAALLVTSSLSSAHTEQEDEGRLSGVKNVSLHSGHSHAMNRCTAGKAQCWWHALVFNF